MIFIAGLGYPGLLFERSRLNVGFMVVDEMSFRLQTPWMNSFFNGLTSDFFVGGDKLILV
ncbi:hypothetical protein DK292_15755 [Listeria monocytogenes]|nr:hypothetical protein DK292_15755 [Listeria monocytogenes]